jgi:chemotaxis protein methyltransferase CheR
MQKDIDNALLVRLNEHFADQLGLHFPHNRLAEFKRNFKQVAKEFGMEPTNCAIWLLNGPLTQDQINVIAFHYTIGETYFFRDPKVFEVLEDELRWLISRRRRNNNKFLHFWSAGCCTGEEPYSLAMMLRRILPDIDTWHISIIGTDINPEFLKKAKKGIYTGWSFRITPAAVRDKYFRDLGGGKYEMTDEIRNMVQFTVGNLAETKMPQGIVPGSIDIILCRNVLIYFHQDQITKVLSKLNSALTDEGLLVVTPIELLGIADKLFERLNYPGVAVLKKAKRPGPFTIAGAQPAVHHNALSLAVDTPGIELPTTSPYHVPALAGSSVELGMSNPFERTMPTPAPVVAPVPVVSPAPVVETPPAIPDSELAKIAQRFFDQGRYKECVAQLLNINPSQMAEPARVTMLALAYSNDGDLPAALTWIDKAIAHDKLNHSLYYVKATILQAQGKISEAIASLNQALFLTPDFVVAEFNLASLLFQTGKSAEAAKRFRNTLRLLKQYNGNDILPESEGITAGRLSKIVEALLAEATQ